MWAAKRERLYRVYVEYGLTPGQARAALDRREAREAEVREVVAREVTRPHPVPVMPAPTRAVVGYEDALRLATEDMLLHGTGAVKVSFGEDGAPRHSHVPWTSICDRVADPLAPLRGGAGSAVR